MLRVAFRLPSAPRPHRIISTAAIFGTTSRQRIRSHGGIQMPLFASGNRRKPIVKQSLLWPWLILSPTDGACVDVGATHGALLDLSPHVSH
jgi:hypothetical protein